MAGHRDDDVDPIRRFEAPWSGLLVLMTAIGCTALIGIPILVLSVIPTDEAPESLRILMIVIFPLILGITALFVVRSFDVHQDVILVRRLLWDSRLPYEGLRSVEVDPDAMKGSIRTIGNGGLFSFTGSYRSRKLGTFRAYATDMKLSVLLKYEDRTVVVTPESPGEFADMVRRFSGAM